MKYANVTEGSFVERPNRFIAHVDIGDRREICHVKNTGRCRELLVPGAAVYLTKTDRTDRKTKYDLIGVRKGDRLVNMDSQLPNAAAFEWIYGQREAWGIACLKREVKHGSSRFDLWGKKTDGKEFFIEVKGVTLEEDGVVRFPDAPTERGIKHVEELAMCVGEGYGAAVLFVIQMDRVKWFEPNMVTHPAFGEALKKARDAGVQIRAVCCDVKPDEMNIKEEVKVRLPL